MISLPVELLKPIVREAAPAVFAGNEQYKQRRATLLNLCLTSRTFCEIAQPMLAEVLQTRHQPGMGQGRASPPFYPVPKDVGAVIAPQVIALDVLNQHWINGRMPLAYLACTSLRDLSLGGMLIQLRFVAKLPQLRYLALESCEIDLGNYGSMPAFPLVEQLSVSDCVVYHYDYGLGDFFSPKYFPKARAFAVLDTCQDDHKDFPVILPPRDWGDQLDVLAYDSVTAEALSIDGDSTALRRPEVIVLFDLEDFDIRSLPRDAPANICLSIDTTPTSSPLHPRTVTNLTKTLTSLCPLRLHPDLAAACNAVVRICEDRGTVVLWGEDVFAGRSKIPKVFLEHRRRVKKQ
ncbi:hypothetical protein JCM8097_002520 [Rhodosporidiobolus ruineniae]